MTCNMFWEKKREYTPKIIKKSSKYEMEEIGTTGYLTIAEIADTLVIDGNDPHWVRQRIYTLISRARKSGEKVIVCKHRMFEFREVHLGQQ